MSIRDEVLSCLQDAIFVEEKHPDDIDPEELAIQMGMTTKTVINKIRKQIRAGKQFAGHELEEIRVRSVLGNNNRKIVFRIKKDPS